MSVGRWFKVEFYGQPPQGAEPIIPGDWEATLAVAGTLAEVFGFEKIDSLALIPCGPAPEDAVPFAIGESQ